LISEIPFTFLGRSVSTYSASRPLRIGIIPGDGIGKEVIPAAEKLLRAIATDLVGSPAGLTLVPLEAGFETFQKTGNSLPPKTLEELRYWLLLAVVHQFIENVMGLCLEQSALQLTRWQGTQGKRGNTESLL
jgi:hypothetical protein